jgi:class 3 adenylate cyclase
LCSGGQILVSQATYDLSADTIQVNLVGDQYVKGREESVTVYEVLDTWQE